MSTNSIKDVVIIGAGLVGLATAYKLLQADPSISLTVLEKESGPAKHQSGRNSGVLHTGIYYKPGSLRAKYCTAGKAELEEFARERNINFEQCGKVIVATEDRELEYLDELFKRGQANGIPDLKKIDSQELEEIEPTARGVAAIHVPTAGIIDFPEVAEALVQFIRESKNGEVSFSEELEKVDASTNSACCITSKRKISTKRIINCSGLQADRVAKRSGANADLQISPFRGDYFILSEGAAKKVNGLIYPVPDPQFPFLGVHVTRMIDGRVECGPSAVPCLDREGYQKSDISLKDSLESALYPGTWKLMAKHWRYGLNEIKRSLFKKQFLADVKKLIPSLELDDLCEARCGIRAVALENDGSVVDDFKIVSSNNCLHVLNAPSPAATACLAIGEHVSGLVVGS